MFLAFEVRLGRCEDHGNLVISDQSDDVKAEGRLGLEIDRTKSELDLTIDQAETCIGDYRTIIPA